MSGELPLLLREDNLLRFIFFRWFKLSVNVPVLVLVLVLMVLCVFECVVVFEDVLSNVALQRHHVQITCDGFKSVCRTPFL